MMTTDPEINCSESYMSLIESGVKSPSVHLLDLISLTLKLSPQEKGELLLIYKRVPNDFEFAVRSNLKESLKLTNLDISKEKYKKDPNKQNFNNLVRILVLEDKKDEALDLLKSANHYSSNFIDLQDRTAKVAGITGNYDFAIQAFSLALEGCSDEFIFTKADILMNIGICYFSKGLKEQNDNTINSLENLLKSKLYLEKSLFIMPDYIYCLDEYARCTYHIADALQFFIKNEIDLKVKPENENLTNLLKAFLKSGKISYKSEIIKNKINECFKLALSTYRSIISHSERGDLPEKALKEALYFHAYTHCKLKQFDEALFLINSINILEPNWLTHFIKVGYYVLRYEDKKNEPFLQEALNNLSIALDYEPETLIEVIKSEKNKELKTLWQLKLSEINQLLEKYQHE
ncbi:MAG: hypothetical protein H7263_03475 [Candidatus Sericytochromatia bacterium]|nr:hypothetical protein [Candidatus Sericytochromatia bacterium]